MTLFKSIPAWQKGADESASRTGQYCHDNLPRTFDCVDMDAVIYKRSGQCMRIIEEKLPGEHLSPAQCYVLPKLAQMIELAVRGKQLRDDSGVYLVWFLKLGARLSEAEDDDPVMVQKVPTNRFDLDGMLCHVTTLGELRPFLSGDYWKMPQTKSGDHDAV